jgi:Sulfite reductase, alpha subunit (flavoprotein)
MLRQLHKYPGLIASLLVVFLALSGVILSVLPALDRAGAPAVPATGTDVATVAGKIAANFPGIEHITRTPSGKVIAFYYKNDQPMSSLVDPATGKAIAPYDRSKFEHWMKSLHRSLFLGDKGRITAGVGAAAMLILTLSGLWMTARRMGGWSKLLSKSRGTKMQRLHVDLARLAVVGLILSSFTGIYITLATFEIIPDGMATPPAFPESVNGGATMPVDQIAPLKNLDLSQLRELVFPYPGDPTDVYTLATDTGDGYIDQSTGEMLTWQPHSAVQQVYETIYMLHTGKGLWWLALLLGLASATVPVMAFTGIVMWWRARKGRPRIRANQGAQAADTIILVGSEGGSTWGFARTLHDSLTKAGHKVHTAPMNSLKPAYRKAGNMFILTATYGDGEAPQSAKNFLARLEAFNGKPDFKVAVLGFGDRQFPKFAQFARDVDAALESRGWERLLDTDFIDRQSTQEFNRWGRDVAKALGEELALEHVPVLPRRHPLTLVSREDYGAEVQAPTSILRFSLPESGLLARITGRAMPKFEAGDLVGIIPPGSNVPRYYSLASSAKDGMLEICVKKHPGGQCSGYLHELQPGDTVQAFIRPNPDFRPAKGKAPVILIGAGTGIGPLAGFIRGNDKARPMHLYFGARDPKSDFLYRNDLEQWLAERKLTGLNAAFSRVENRSYVQDIIKQDAETLRELINNGAHILVCGGRSMANGVMEALEQVLAPTGLEPATLKAQGRYAEDVY